MRRKFWWMPILALGLIPLSPGRSDIIISVDMDPVTPGIQSNIETALGNTVTAGLFMQLTGSTSIATYNFSVQYDRNELVFQSRSETPNALTGLNELDFSNPHDEGLGLLRRFDGTTFGSGPVGPFGPVKIGEVVFTAPSASGGTTDIDVTPGRFEPSFDSFFDNGFAEVTSLVSFVGGSVTTVAPIPEPASMALVGISLMGIGLRRRRRSAS